MLPANVPSGSKLGKLTRTLEAGQEFTFRADMRFFYFSEASFGFEVMIDDGPPLPFNLALGYECAPGEALTSITIRNTLTVASTFVLFYGRGRLIDQRLNVLESRNGSAASLVPNVAVANAPAVITSSSVVSFDANPNAKSRHILISNGGYPFADSDLIQVLGDVLNYNSVLYQIYFRTGGGVVTPSFLIIDPSSIVYGEQINFVLPDYSGSFGIYNATGADISVTVTDVSYGN